MSIPDPEYLYEYDTHVNAPDTEDEEDATQTLAFVSPYRPTAIRGEKMYFTDTGEHVMWWDREFVILSDEDAEQSLKRLQNAQIELSGELSKKLAIMANCDELIAQRQKKFDWIENRISGDLRAMLERKILEKQIKGKTVKTPYGSYGVRDVPEKIEFIADDTEFIEFAKERMWGDVVNVKETLNRTEAKKSIGEFPSDFYKIIPAVPNGSLTLDTAFGVKGKK